MEEEDDDAGRHLVRSRVRGGRRSGQDQGGTESEIKSSDTMPCQTGSSSGGSSRYRGQESDGDESDQQGSSRGSVSQPSDKSPLLLGEWGRCDEDEEEEEQGGPSSPAGLQRVLSDRDHQCLVCWDIVVRPVTLECGFTICEACGAQAISRAWEAGKGGAPCPALGPDCEFGLLTRLPRINITMHNDMQRAHPNDYAARLQEAEAEEVKALVRKVRQHRHNAAPQARDGRGAADAAAVPGPAVPPMAAGRAGGMAGGATSGRPSSPFLCHAVPLLLTLIIMFHSRAQRRDEQLGSGQLDFALAWSFLTSPWGNDWIWASSLAQCRGPRGGGGGAGAEIFQHDLSPATLLQLTRYTNSISRNILRFQVAAGFHPYLHFLACYKLVSNLLNAAYFHVLAGWERGRVGRQLGVPLSSFLLMEVLILCLAGLVRELRARALYLLTQHVWFGLMHAPCGSLFAVPLLGRPLYYLYWGAIHLVLLELVGGCRVKPRALDDYCRDVQHHMLHWPLWRQLLHEPRVTLRSRLLRLSCHLKRD